MIYRKLVYSVGCTLDGFIAGPAGEVDFLPMTEDVVAHVAAKYPEILPTQMHAVLGVDQEVDHEVSQHKRRYDTVIMGRGTYDPALKQGVPSPFAHLRQYVVSRSLTVSPHPDIQLTDDPVRTVAALRGEPGRDIWLAGGGMLANTLLPVIDELSIRVLPVIAGNGVPLFGSTFSPTDFILAGTTVMTGGAVELRYVR